MARSPLFRTVLETLRTAARAEAAGLVGRALEQRLADERGAAGLTRREVLRLGAAAGAASLVPWPARHAWAAAAAAATVPAPTGAPVVILGAGAAGLTAAYRLRQAGVPVEMYEGSARLGGRIYTEHRFNNDGMFCERGGELIDTEHLAIGRLAEELGLVMEDFRAGDAGLASQVFFAGGTLRTSAEMTDGFRPLAHHVKRDLATAFPGGKVVMPTFKAPHSAHRLDQLTLAQYLDEKTDVAKWVKDLVSSCYVAEYGLETSRQSALNLLLLAQFEPHGRVKLLGTSDETRRIRGGNGALITRLHRAIEEGVPIHREYRLHAISDGGAGSELKLVFTTPAGTREVKAGQVICTLPFSVLREIEGIDALALSPVKAKCIRELGYGTNAKLMIGFQERHWRRSPRDGKSGSNGSVLTDQSSQNFWDTSRLQPGASGILTNYFGGDEGRRVRDDKLPATVRELNVIFPGIDGFYDGRRALEHWTSSPFARGSFSCPLPGQYTSIWGCAGSPELGGRLHFAGEHTSVNFAGYMNGAIETGERVARDIASARGLRVSVPGK